MLIAVFADTHGTIEPVREAVKRFGPLDTIFHLGDGVEDAAAAAGEAGIPFCGVAGNEDRTMKYDDSFIFEAGCWKLLLVHGHQVDINPYEEEGMHDARLGQLAYLGRRSGARVLLFGHTHVPMVRVVNGVILCNPGSMYRGSATPPTFAMLEAGERNIAISLLARTPEGDWAKFSSFADFDLRREPSGKR